MPHMNGYQFLEKLSETENNHKVIILTSSKNLIEQEYSKKFKHIKAFISKPFCSESAKVIDTFF